MKHTKVIEVFAIATLPVIFAVACTTNGDNKAMQTKNEASIGVAKHETDGVSQLNNLSFVTAEKEPEKLGLVSEESMIMEAATEISNTRYMISAVDDVELTDKSELSKADAKMIDSAPVEPFVKVKMIEPEPLKLTKPEKTVFNFAVKKYDVTQDDYAFLEQHALYLKENSQLVININGYSDSRGPAKLNYELSTKRAQYVADVLITLGVSESQIVVNGYGESFPLNAESNWDENRRVEMLYIEKTHEESLMLSSK